MATVSEAMVVPTGPFASTKAYDVCYLLFDTGKWGGVKGTLVQINGLVDRGYRVCLVSRADPPDWFDLKGDFVRAPELTPRDVPDAEIVIGTWYPTAAVAARVKDTIPVHYSRGYEAQAPELSEKAKQSIAAVYRLPTVKIANSPHVARLIEDTFGQPAWVVRNDIDHTIFYPAAERAAKAEDAPLDVLVVGPFEVPWKGIRDCLAACERLRERYGRRLRVTRVSQSPLTADEVAVSGAFGADYVYHHDLDERGMAALYNRSDLLLVGSYPSVESFGRPVMEALACGLPAVVTDIPAYRDYDAVHDFALFVSPGDPAAMAAAATRALEDAALRLALRTRGLEVAAQYSNERTLDDLERALREIRAQRNVARTSAGPRRPQGSGPSSATAEVLARATAEFDAGRTRQAIDAIMEALKRSPSERSLYGRLIEFLLESERFQDALDVADEMPGDMDAPRLVYRGQALQGLKRLDEAEEAAKKALALDAAFAPALDLLGVVAFHSGRADEAIELFRRANRADPRFADALTNHGAASWARGERDAALELLAQGFELAPTKQSCASSYFWAAGQAGKLDHAEARIDRARRLHPNSRLLALLYVDLLVEQQRFEAALAAIDEVAARFGNDEQLVAFAATIRQHTGGERAPEVLPAAPDAPAGAPGMPAANEPRVSGGPAPESADAPRTVVYTAIFDQYDDVPEVSAPDPAVRYVLFTDDPRLPAKAPWQIRVVPRLFEDPELDARRVKLLPHLYLPEFELSVWIDANCQLRRASHQELSALLGDGWLAAPSHESHGCVYRAAHAFVLAGRDSAARIDRQLAYYDLLGLPRDAGLHATMFLVRRHLEPECRRFDVLWWEHVSQHSKRDELGFECVRWITSAPVVTLALRYTDNDVFGWGRDGSGRHQGNPRTKLEHLHHAVRTDGATFPFLVAAYEPRFERWGPEYMLALRKLNTLVHGVGERIEGNLCYFHLAPSFVFAPPDPRRGVRRENFLRALVGRKRALELGFNAGHSALLALFHSPIDYTALDIALHRYTEPAAAHLAREFPGRFRFLKMDTTQLYERRNELDFGSFDLVHIDGGHGDGVYANDVLTILHLCQVGTHVLVDDVYASGIASITNRLVSEGYLEPYGDLSSLESAAFVIKNTYALADAAALRQAIQSLTRSIAAE